MGYLGISSGEESLVEVWALLICKQLDTMMEDAKAFHIALINRPIPKTQVLGFCCRVSFNVVPRLLTQDLQFPVIQVVMTTVAYCLYIGVPLPIRGNV